MRPSSPPHLLDLLVNDPEDARDRGQEDDHHAREKGHELRVGHGVILSLSTGAPDQPDSIEGGVIGRSGRANLVVGAMLAMLDKSSGNSPTVLSLHMSVDRRVVVGDGLYLSNA
jgi:hypothetical protein